MSLRHLEEEIVVKIVKRELDWERESECGVDKGE